MTETRSLSRFYGKFFVGCVDLAIVPYTLTLGLFLDPKQPKTAELVMGVGACIFFSTIIPVLPTLFSLTFAVAMLAASLAVASMFVAYPIALLADGLKTSDSFEDGFRFTI